MVKDSNTRIMVTISKDTKRLLDADATKQGVSTSKAAGDIIRDHYDKA